MQTKQFWDKKALDFPRYDEENNQFQQKIITILKEKNILTKNSTLLDIGCGTGIYTIPLAKYIKKILALDISSTMLDILKEDSWNNNVNNIIQTKCSNWQDFKSDDKFDVVFASLSAAFHNNADFEKILDYSKKHIIILDFVDTKGSSFEKLLFDKLGIKEHLFKDTEKIKQWLDSKRMNYKTIPLSNQYVKLLDKNVAISKIKELFRISDFEINMSDEEILKLLKPLTNQGKVKEEFNMKLELIYWEKDHI